jgi:GTP-sensing pleiotropic transcriptional regulator CodY
MNENLKYLDRAGCQALGKLITLLLSLGFKHTETLAILLCLSELDEANHLRVDISEIADKIKVTKRVVYYALDKAKGFGLLKEEGRYFFGDFITELVSIQTNIGEQ